MKDQYRTETNKDVYAETGDLEAGKASYNDHYVHWLEKKATRNRVYICQGWEDESIVCFLDEQQAVEYCQTHSGFSWIAKQLHL